MGTRSVTTITTGESGSGKSYSRCARFIVDDFLKNHDGPHISNFPLGVVPEDHHAPPEYDGETFVDRIAEKAAKLHGLDADELRERIEVIPEAELNRWQSGESGPWEYFENRSLQDAHIAIDEAHCFCGKKSPAPIRESWRHWLAEIRHQGATVEFLSQNLDKIAMEIRREAGCHIEVKNTETERDPVFRIELADWYELRAAITGRYSSNVMEQERRSAMGVAKGWTSRRIFPLEPWYFRFYDSFSAPQQGGNKGKAQRKQYQRHSKLGLLGWFVTKNAGKLAGRAAFGLALCWLFFGQYVGLGGGPWVIKSAMQRVSDYGTSVSAGVEAGMTGDTAYGQATAAGAQSGSRSRDAEASTSSAWDTGSASGALAAPEEVLAVVLELREQLDRIQAENAALRAAIDNTAEVTAISRSSVTFRNGFTYRVGEVIDHGAFDGRRINAIDWRKRAALLDDGTRLRMGRLDTESLTQRMLDSVNERTATQPGP